MKPSDYIRMAIGAMEDRYGADKAFPVTVELLKAYEAARKMEETECVTVRAEASAPACGIDCQAGCARGYKTPDECFSAGRKWPRDGSAA